MKLEYLLNRIYYSLFRIVLFLWKGLEMTIIWPSFLTIHFILSFLPWIKKNLHKNGLTLEKVMKYQTKVSTDYTWGGACIHLTMDFMTFFLAAGIVGILNTLKILFIKVEVDSNVKSLITLLELFLIAYTTGFYFLWRKDKYLAYFKRFEQEPKRKTRIWCFITIVLYMAILVLFFWSLRWGSI